MTQEEILIRKYRPGDEATVIKMLHDIFGINRTVEQWNWQFKNHVQGQAWITVAEVRNEMVGHCCMMRNHLSLMGREIIAGQRCDTMVRSDQRGKKCFIRMGIRNYRDAAKEGVAAVFSFPNRDSYLGLVRYLGWRRITNLRYYFYRIGFQKIWGSKIDHVFKYFQGMPIRLKYTLLRYLHKDLEIVVSSHLPEGLEDTLKEIRDYEVLSIWKDVQYLRWRYENHPDRHYTFHILNAQRRPEGLVVSTDYGKRIAICDLLHRTKDVPQSAFLLSHVLLYYQTSTAQKIEFYGYDSGFFDAVFSACGFSIIPTSNFIFGGRVFDDKKLENLFILPQNWTIAYGDTDVI